MVLRIVKGVLEISDTILYILKGEYYLDMSMFNWSA